MKLKITEFFTLILLLLVTGLFWGTWFAMTRSIGLFTAEEFTKIGKVIIQNVAAPMRIIFPGCLLLMVLSIWLSPRKRSVGFYLKLVAILLMVAALLITLLVEVPIDNQLKDWTPETLPMDWEAIRERWALYHILRTFMSLMGFTAFLASVVTEQTSRRYYGIAL